MGENTKDTRRTSPPRQCVGCGCIRMGEGWAADRRGPSESPYSHGICPKCRAEYYLASLKQGEGSGTP